MTGAMRSREVGGPVAEGYSTGSVQFKDSFAHQHGLSMQKICNLITHLFDLMVAVCFIYLCEVCGSDSLLPRLLLSLGCLLKCLNPSASSHEGLHQ